jgi:transposase
VTEIETRFNLIHGEHERIGDSITDISSKYGVSRKTYYYKWKKRYLVQGIEGLKDRSRKAAQRKRKEVNSGYRTDHPRSTTGQQ